MSLNNNKCCTIPVIRDAEGALSDFGGGLQGGIPQPSVPSITVTIQNENAPTFWTEETLEPHLDEDGNFIYIDNV